MKKYDTQNKRRNQILDCAAKLFLEKGFDNTSVNEIVEATNISKGLVYHYFRSKDELIQEILKRNIEMATLPMQEMMYSNKKFSIKIATLLQHMAQMATHHNLAKLRVNGDMAIVEQIQKMIFEYIGPITKQLIQQGKEEGFVTKDYGENVFLAFMFSLMVYFCGIEDKVEETIEEKVEVAITLMENVLGIEEGRILAECIYE